MDDIRQLLYCSRNRILGIPEQVDEEVLSILTSSRRNNIEADVTGALLFDGLAFTQVLEGPLAIIEKIFERIQCDPRHSDVTLLENRSIASRQFPDWSMAFADPSQVRTVPTAERTVAQAFSAPSNAGAAVLNLLHRLILDKKDWLPGR